MNGYVGKILEVDLNTSRLADRSIDEKTARKFLGGKGLGLDTISTGATIACAMELVENGKIPESRLHGLNLAFGNAGAMVEAVWMTAYRAGHRP